MWLFRRVLVIYWPDREYHPFLFACIFDCIDIMDDAWGFILIHMWQFACGWYLMRVYFHTSEGYPHSGTPRAVRLMDFPTSNHQCAVLFAYFCRLTGFKYLLKKTWNMLIASWDIAWMSKPSHLFTGLHVLHYCHPFVLMPCYMEISTGTRRKKRSRSTNQKGLLAMPGSKYLVRAAVMCKNQFWKMRR
jgi:hypothetical protein